jgi:hypothetical protein
LSVNIQEKSEKRASAHARSTLVIWRKRATDMARMHDISRTHFMRISACLGISSLTLSVVSSSSALFGEVSEGGTSTLGILIGAFGVLSTVLVSINAFISPGKLEQEHEECHRKYVKLARDITVNLHLDKVGSDQMFININQFIRYIHIIMDDMEDTAPPIPRHIIRGASTQPQDAGSDSNMYRFSDSDCGWDLYSPESSPNSLSVVSLTRSVSAKGGTTSAPHARTTLTVWRQRATDMARLHNTARTYFRNICAALTLTSLSTSVLSSSSVVFGGLTHQPSVDSGFGVAIGIMSVAATVLISINAFLKPGMLQHEHEECHRKYLKFARDITVHLHLDHVGSDQMFMNIHQCMRYMQSLMDDMEDMSPSIPMHIINAFGKEESKIGENIDRFSSDRPRTPKKNRDAALKSFAMPETAEVFDAFAISDTQGPSDTVVEVPALQETAEDTKAPEKSESLKSDSLKSDDALPAFMFDARRRVSFSVKI